MKRKWLHVIESEETGRPLDDATRQQLLETHPDLPILQGMPLSSDHSNAHDMLAYQQQQHSSHELQQLPPHPPTESDFPDMLKHEHDRQLEQQHHESPTDSHLHPDLASASYFPDPEAHHIHDPQPEAPTSEHKISEANVDFNTSSPDLHQRSEVEFDNGRVEQTENGDDAKQSLHGNFGGAPAIDSKLEQQLHDQITAAAVAAVAVAEAAEAAAASAESENS